MAKLICSSCKKALEGSRGVVKFLCPKCLKYEIIRCELCRKIVAKYKCPACGFIGPN